MTTAPVNVVDHPLVQHKLSLMREKDRSTKNFREILNEIGMLLGYEVTRDLPLELVDIETPLSPMKAPMIAGKKLTFGADPARRRRISRRHAGAGALGPRRPYRALSRSRDVAGRGILLQGAAGPVGPHRDPDGPDAGDRQLGLRRRDAAQEARRPRHPLRLPVWRRRKGSRTFSRSIPTCRCGPRRSTRG